MEHFNTSLDKRSTMLHKGLKTVLIYSFLSLVFWHRWGGGCRREVILPMGIWQRFADPVQLLSSSKATGPCVSQPITSPKHSAAHNYRSERVTASLSRVGMARHQFHPAISYVFLSAITSGTEIQQQHDWRFLVVNQIQAANVLINEMCPVKTAHLSAWTFRY